MKVRVPGDKSLTQRSLILSALAEGESRISGLLFGGDADSTAGALRALGASIPELPEDGSEIVVRGVGLQGLSSPEGTLDLGNSGTGTRLLLGVLAGSSLEAAVTGDESLRGRPMKRVTDPLSAMGAHFEYQDEDGRLPVRVTGAHPLQAIDWPSPVASAQIKSSILFAGLTGGAFALVTEPHQSRDHTERLFHQVGVSTVSHAVAGGWHVELRSPPARIQPLHFRVPGDVSSAAFVAALAALGGTQDPVQIVDVGLNPTRTAFLDVLARMGAHVSVDAPDAGRGEPVGTLAVSASALTGVDVTPDEIPRMIDELPLVAVLGARAEGLTRIRNAAELRTKETDRIAALVHNLRALGVEVHEYDDGLDVTGSDRPLQGDVRAFHDHRIAMAFGVLAALEGNAIHIDDPSTSDVSFPGFWDLIRQLVGGASV